MKYFLAITILFIMQNCVKHNYYKDDVLSIQRTDYTGDELRIDGYYYLLYADDEYITTNFFYKNGILLHGNAWLISDMEEQESKYADGRFYNHAKEIKYMWGVFKIEGDQIKFERWYPSSGGPLHAYVRSGIILNDTTFHITESYRMQNGEKTDVSTKDEIYRFKQFSPKPDSTNVFVN